LKVLRERSSDASPRGALEALILFLGGVVSVNYAAAATNWIDPERAPVAPACAASWPAPDWNTRRALLHPA
jgi:hypothetical protein